MNHRAVNNSAVPNKGEGDRDSRCSDPSHSILRAGREESNNRGLQESILFELAAGWICAHS